MLLVLAFHAGVPGVSGGHVGVDVFFVLSGFLITSILIREHNATGGIALGRFVARRTRRLLPLAVLVLVGTAVAMRLLNDPVTVARARPGVLSAAVYASNWVFLGQSVDYFAHDDAVSPVLHFWSLSVEEQFYALWPLALLGLATLKAAPRRVTGLLAVASLVWAVHVGGMHAYFGTHTRAWQPLAGAALAFGVPHVRGARWLAGVGLAALVVAALSVVPLPGTLSRGVVAVGGTGLLVCALESDARGPVGWALQSAPARFVGRISYGLYLWHWPLVVLAEPWLPEPGWLRLLALGAASTALATASYYGLERPLRTRLPDRPWVALGAVVGAAAAAGLGWVLLPVSPATRALLAEASPVTELYAVERAGAPVVVLAGDSHADNWGPALEQLARTRGFTLVPVVERGCSWVRTSGPPKCEAFRSELVRTVQERRPTLTLLVAGTVDPNELAEGMSLLQPVAAASAHVVLMEPIPEMRDPLPCLAERGADCDAPAEQGPHHDALEAALRAAASDAGVSVADLDAAICPQGICPARVGLRVTRLDAVHLAPGYAATLTDVLAQALPLPQ